MLVVGQYLSNIVCYLFIEFEMGFWKGPLS